MTRRRRPAPERGVRLPLGALRPTLDAGSRRAVWSIHSDGVLGRSLLTQAGPPYSVPLALEHPVGFTARVILMRHDWRDGRGKLRAAVMVTDRSGRRRRLWSRQITAGDRGRPRGVAVRCTIPADSIAMHLRLEVIGTLRTGSVTRALWLEPALHDPGAVTLPPHPADLRHLEAMNDPSQPLISVLVPVHDPPPQMLADAIESVRAQTFAGWELCLLDDGSRDPVVIEMLRRCAREDARIRLARHETARGISAATNGALALANGEYVALLDHDDRLTADALMMIAERIADEPELDMLYSDEEVVFDAAPGQPHIKPGWSPEHIATAMYTCHLGVYRRAIAQRLGGFRSRFDGCQDYDFLLRFTDVSERIAHVPEVLYHWRAHAASTASGDQAKPYAYLAQRGAIDEHLRRVGIDASVHYGRFPGLHRIVHRVPSQTSVSIALAVDSVVGLREAARSLAHQPHQAWTARIAAPARHHDEIRELWREVGIEQRRLAVLDDAGADGRTGALHLAAAGAESDHLVLMQAPAVGLTVDWLTRMLGYSAQAGVGAAGPTVVSCDGRLAQDGIALPEGLPLHMHHGDALHSAHAVVYNVMAVSGVLATSCARYARTGGLTPDLRELALIDYCLRCGGRTVIIPDVRVRSVGTDIVVNDLAAIDALRRRWRKTAGEDPYYSPAYRTDRGDMIPAAL